VVKATGKKGTFGQDTYQMLKWAKATLKPGDFVLVRNAENPEEEPSVVEIRELFQSEDVASLMGRRYVSPNVLRTLPGAKPAAALHDLTTSPRELIETSAASLIAKAESILKVCHVAYVRKIPTPEIPTSRDLYPKMHSAAELDAVYYSRHYYDIEAEIMVKRVSPTGNILNRTALGKLVNAEKRTKKQEELRKQQEKEELAAAKAAQLAEEAKQEKECEEEEEEEEEEVDEHEASEYERARRARLLENREMLENLFD